MSPGISVRPPPLMTVAPSASMASVETCLIRLPSGSDHVEIVVVVDTADAITVLVKIHVFIVEGIMPRLKCSDSFTSMPLPITQLRSVRALQKQKRSRLKAGSS
jgi:hypothetical protein